jgi:DNA-binding response OmpR family regulator
MLPRLHPLAIITSWNCKIGETTMTKTNEILETLGIRAETNRALVIAALAAKIGKPVPRSAILKRVYGTDDAASAKKLAFVLIELRDKVERFGGKSIKFKQTDVEGEICYQLNA